MTTQKTKNNDKMKTVIAKTFNIDKNDISLVDHNVNDILDSTEMDSNTEIKFWTNKEKLKDEEVRHVKDIYNNTIKNCAENIYPQELDIHISISDDIEIIIEKIDDGKAKEVL